MHVTKAGRYSKYSSQMVDPILDYLHIFRVNAKRDSFFQQLREKELVGRDGVWDRAGIDRVMAIRIPIENNMHFLDNCFRQKKGNDANIFTI